MLTDMAYKKREVLAAELEEAEKRIVELEATKAELLAEQTVMLSARVPRRLREEARYIGGQFGVGMQEVVTEALEAWIAERRDRLDQLDQD